MKVVTKMVEIENEEFVLIRGNSSHGEYYGTIPYSEIDENGKLRRQLNGYEMAIVFSSDCHKCYESPIAMAIYERRRHIRLDKFIAEGHSEQEIMQFILKM